VFRRDWNGISPRAQVETVVVEGDGVAEALLRYMHESGVRSLVLGSASFRWFRR
jgi:nucleotide-binding universal stress UspA family protein